MVIYEVFLKKESIIFTFLQIKSMILENNSFKLHFEWVFYNKILLFCTIEST